MLTSDEKATWIADTSDERRASVKIGPLISYYGAKWRSAVKYPAPRFATVIEPFAGSAGYSLRHSSKNVLLRDTSHHIKSSWEFLLAAARDPSLIASLPGDEVQSIDEVPLEARALVGFWLNPGSASSHRSRSKRAISHLTSRPGSVWSNRTRDRLAKEVAFISHWQFALRHWHDTFCEIAAFREPVTVFVDPPYQEKGHYYIGKKWTIDDFNLLALACQEIASYGHEVIVCERAGATWLPFEILHIYHGTRYGGVEVIWHAKGAA